MPVTAGVLAFALRSRRMLLRVTGAGAGFAVSDRTSCKVAVMRAAVGMFMVVAAVAGCGTSDDRHQARQVVERFYDAVRHDRGANACAQLSSATIDQLESQSGQPCRAAVTRLEYEGGAIVDTQVYITNAKVDLRNGESAFLNREATGWKLSAIACKPAQGKPRDRPFECEVQA